MPSRDRSARFTEALEHVRNGVTWDDALRAAGIVDLAITVEEGEQLAQAEHDVEAYDETIAIIREAAKTSGAAAQWLRRGDIDVAG